MTDDLKQDFEAAVIKHLLFKSKLRSALYGRLTDEAALRDPQACTFGKWVDQRALGTYRHLPESQILDASHRRIHQMAGRLLDQYQNGDPEGALAGLPAVNQLADQITVLLRTMEAKLRVSS